MTGSDEDGESEAVGFGRPPKSRQFRKGQSGNPHGRPRKKVEERPTLAPARFPTREVIRAEAARAIAIKDASGSQTILAREGVMRAITLSAMRGGVMAGRTFMQMIMAEDERYHAERRKSFDFWRDYQERGRADIAAALKAGKAAPDLLPHPEDIVLDWANLDVRFSGAMDEEGLEREKNALAFQDLGFEMSYYTEEENHPPGTDGEDGRLGLYMAIHLAGRLYLPPRLRTPMETLEQRVWSGFMQDRSAWGDDLQRRCKDTPVPFMRYHKRKKPPSMSCAEAGIEWKDGVVQWRRPRKRTRKAGRERSDP